MSPTARKWWVSATVAGGKPTMEMHLKGNDMKWKFGMYSVLAITAVGLL
jgi:hypothetical protein